MATSPQLGRDEIERLGYKLMHNGREVDQANYWDASEKVQQKYLLSWTPVSDDLQLAANWTEAGGRRASSGERSQ
jgi:hypothetical protein